MNENALKQISALPDMDRDELKEMWKSLFDTSPGKYTKEFMIRKIAWRIQEMTYGGLPEATKTKIKKLQKNPRALGDHRHKKNLPPVGTQLCREHGGQEHRVMILEDGFEYRGCKYKSLSEIASKITGTNWSGPRFFGLTSR